MNNKVVLGVVCAAIVAGLIYNQQESVSEPLLSVDSEILEKVNKSRLANTLESSTNKESTPSNILLTEVQSADFTDDNSASSIASSADSSNQVNVQAQKHEQSADHFSDQQPKAHGHENQRRNREDNSLIPPGEPKKALPKQDNNG
jgi:hypothetical protein